MSWVKKICDAIDEAQATGNNLIAESVIQAAMNEITAKLQAVTDTIPSADYPLFFVGLRLVGKAVGSGLGPADLLMAALIEARVSQTIVRIPERFRKEEQA